MSDGGRRVSTRRPPSDGTSLSRISRAVEFRTDAMMFDVAESISITSGVSGSAPAPQAPVLGGEGFGVHGVELAGVARGFC